MLAGVASGMLGLALTCLSSSAPPRDKPTSDVTTITEPPRVRIHLSGPTEPIHVWAASEWSIRFENDAAVPLPFSEHLFEPAGDAGARVLFEIAKGDKVLRTFPSRSFDLSSNCWGPSARGIQPGEAGELPVVLHGEMLLDFQAYTRDEEVYTRFVPAFETPGRHTVTAQLSWRLGTIRSNPVTVEVGDVPVGAKQALAGLKELAKAGICVDVRGLFYNCPLSRLETIAEYVEREKHTLYGAQLQLGLAEALLVLVQTQIDPERVPLPHRVYATLPRVKSLLPQVLPLDFGLERTLALVRAQVDAKEREVRSE